MRLPIRGIICNNMASPCLGSQPGTWKGQLISLHVSDGHIILQLHAPANICARGCPVLTNIEIVLIIWVSNKLNQSGNRGWNETMEHSFTHHGWPGWVSSSPCPAPRPLQHCRAQCPGSRPPPRAAGCRWCCHTWQGPTSGTHHATWWWSHSWWS